MKVIIEQTTTCFACGIQTPYEVREHRVMTPQEFLHTKLAILEELHNCTVIPEMDSWHKNNEDWQLVVMGTPVINGKLQGATSVWFTVTL